MVFNHPRNTVGWRVNGPCLKGATTNLGNFSIPNNTLIMISCQLVPGFWSQEKSGNNLPLLQGGGVVQWWWCRLQCDNYTIVWVLEGVCAMSNMCDRGYIHKTKAREFLSTQKSRYFWRAGRRQTRKPISAEMLLRRCRGTVEAGKGHKHKHTIVTLCWLKLIKEVNPV